jgi:uncharacterized protein YciI
MSDDERGTMQAHVAYWSGLLDAGSVLAFGPVNDPDQPHGIGIVVAEDMAAAEALRDADPAQQSPHGFRTEIVPMVALVTPGASYPS